MKCRECSACHLISYRRWNSQKQEFENVPMYECWGVKESFEITDINRECTEYPEKRNTTKGVGDKMIDWKIFRAGRGEGKTKWLLDRAIDADINDGELYYVGSKKTMFQLVEMWMAQEHTLCPIKHIENVHHYDLLDKVYFFTDGLIENIDDVSSVCDTARAKGVTWYVTMNKEDFVN